MRIQLRIATRTPVETALPVRVSAQLLAMAWLAASVVGVGHSPAEAGWIALPNAPVAPFNGRHDDVFFVSPNLGWVVNGAGQIHRTTDGGQSWTLQKTVPNYLRSVGFATSLKGWTGALHGSPLLYATEDGGVTWTPVVDIPDPQPTGICGLWVVNTSVVYGCGRYDGPPATMIKTIDGGATWTSWDMGAYATNLIDCYFIDENHGFVVGGTGSPSFRHAVILATTDGGATWQTRHVTSRPGAEWCWKISFPTPTDGFVSIERQDGLAPTYVLKTMDGGLTWTEVPFLDDFDVQGIGFATPDLGWVGGWGGPTYESTDSGANWHLAGFGDFVNRIRFLDSTLGYAVGQTVYRYTDDATDVSHTSRETPALAVAQNHPNPANTSTRIAFSLGTDARVRVTIHDVRGRMLLTLFDRIRPAGPTELSWDLRDRDGRPVRNGVYWSRIEAPTQADSRKLLVVR